MDSTRKNKRNGHDSVAHEVRWATITYHDFQARLEKTLRVDKHYTFLSSVPVWREIIATDLSGRMTDHELCDPLEPYFEKELHERTFNNRKGKGSMAAINQVIEDIYEVSEGFTVDCRIIKWDLSGFFPNALWSYMETFIVRVIEKNKITIENDYGKGYVDYLKWLTMITINCNPAGHVEFRTPRFFWYEHIKPEKSILTKDEGVGAPIGRLPSQKAMGLYLNDEIRWLNDEGIRATLFMDDCVMVVPEERHAYALRLLPILREKLRLKGIKLNEKKFYDQPCSHGLEFLGTHIVCNRLHLNDKTYQRCMDKVEYFNKIVDKEVNLDSFLSCINSYIGLLKNRTDYGRILEILRNLSLEWWKYCHYNVSKVCISKNDSQKNKIKTVDKVNILYKQIVNDYGTYFKNS